MLREQQGGGEPSNDHGCRRRRLRGRGSDQKGETPSPPEGDADGEASSKKPQSEKPYVMFGQLLARPPRGISTSATPPHFLLPFRLRVKGQHPPTLSSLPASSLPLLRTPPPLSPFLFSLSLSLFPRPVSGEEELLRSCSYVFAGKGGSLPKFGDWDVTNPASAEGFTVIFNKARDEKKTTGTRGDSSSPQWKNGGGYGQDPNYVEPRKSRKWFCCG